MANLSPSQPVQVNLSAHASKAPGNIPRFCSSVGTADTIPGNNIPIKDVYILYIQRTCDSGF